MTPLAEFDTRENLAAQTRLLRLARYRALQLRLERERRQQTARRRLLALQRDHAWGWLAL